jgi:broad specificity phosphatase PhoE
VARIYIVQHAEKRRDGTDPALTERGHAQARATADRVAACGIDALYASPLLRARQTAAPIAAATGLAITIEDRVRERMTWDGHQPLDEFFADWVRATADRSYVPRCGDSSFAAAERFRAFLLDHEADDRRIAVVAHGGVTVDLVRSLIGDDALDRELIDNGVPACAITVIDGLRVQAVAIGPDQANHSIA